jgi:hypothetical protein
MILSTRQTTLPWSDSWNIVCLTCILLFDSCLTELFFRWLLCLSSLSWSIQPKCTVRMASYSFWRQQAQGISSGQSDRSYAGLGIFLFTTVSRQALGPTHPPIQWVLGALSMGVKRPGREANNSSPSSAEVKECVELYLHSPYVFMGRYLVKHRDVFTFTTWVPGAPSLELKEQGREAGRSPPSSAEGKHEWSCTSTTNAHSWRDAKLKHRDNFTFTNRYSSVKEKFAVLDLSNARLMCSNPGRGVDVFVCIYIFHCVGRGLAVGRYLVPTGNLKKKITLSQSILNPNRPGALILKGERYFINSISIRGCGEVVLYKYIQIKLFLWFSLTEHHAMKSYWGSGGIAPLILWPRHYMEMSGHFHEPAALPPGKEPLVPIG